MYFNCEIVKIFQGVESVNPDVRLLLELLKPPTKAECIKRGITGSDDQRGRASQRAWTRDLGQTTARRSILGARADSDQEARAEMQKRAPTLGNMLVIILFVLSCFGLLMFLWESFGGPLPLKPKGYRFTVAFPRTFALAEESDVRISGVEVGHVSRSKPRQATGARTRRSKSPGQYAPIRATCTRSCARRRCSGRPTCS